MAEQEANVPEINIDKQRLGAIYANALLGANGDTAASVVGDLDALIDELLNPSPELESILASPRIPASEKEGILTRILGSQVSEALLTFLKVVAQHGRLDCLRQVRTAAHDELQRMQGRLTVLVTTAEPLTPDLESQIAERLQAATGQPVDLQCRLDTQIIGGMVVRVGDTVYDGSVVNQLEQLRRDTLGKTFNQMRKAVDRFAVTG